jgi:hypothetical protein
MRPVLQQGQAITSKMVSLFRRVSGLSASGMVKTTWKHGMGRRRSSRAVGVEEDQRRTDLAIGLAGDLLFLDHVEQVLTDLLLAHLGGRAHVIS